MAGHSSVLQNTCKEDGSEREETGDGDYPQSGRALELQRKAGEVILCRAYFLLRRFRRIAAHR